LLGTRRPKADGLSGDGAATRLDLSFDVDSSFGRASDPAEQSCGDQQRDYSAFAPTREHLCPPEIAPPNSTTSFVDAPFGFSTGPPWVEAVCKRLIVTGWDESVA
jgi:hypothetical protein